MFDSRRCAGFFAASLRRIVFRAAAFVRVGAVACVILCISLVLLARSAAATMGEALRGFGEKMMLEYPGARYESGPRTLAVNGTNIHLVTASVSQDLPTVLDHFEDLCRERGGIEDAERVLAKLGLAKNGARPRHSVFGGVARTEKSKEGTVACVDTWGALGLGELARRLQRFAKSGDLVDLGELRYVLARKTDKGTSVLLLWTSGSAPLRRMFPPTGDSPGPDPAGVPRPPDVRRILSASELGMPYGISVYVAKSQTPADLERFYRKELPRAGWVVERSRRVGRNDDGVSILVRSRVRELAIVLTTNARHETVVSVETLA